MNDRKGKSKTTAEKFMLYDSKWTYVDVLDSFGLTALFLFFSSKICSNLAKYVYPKYKIKFK